MYYIAGMSLDGILHLFIYREKATVELRRLEDRIRELCGKSLVATDAEFNQTMTELRKALREHAHRLRQLVSARTSLTETTHRTTQTDLVGFRQRVTLT